MTRIFDSPPEATTRTIGSLIVITGSMFSGKTEELIRRVRRALYARRSVQVFKHAIDTRSGRPRYALTTASRTRPLPSRRARIC